ncbi:MAG: hypothetical protein J6A49_10115 [Clostridia bacterium]|nr:hypothetical protein [Clostridia bacterium]
MKKSRLTKLIAVILALTLTFSSFGAVTVGASSAYPITESDNPIGVIFSDIIDTLLQFILDLFSGLFGDGPGFVDKDTAVDLAGANYYEGIGKEFVSEAEEDAKWNIGYANESLIPADYDNGSYYIGGYIAPENGFTNVVEGIAQIPGLGKDDMKVRCIAINDGTDKGTVLFATIDCIGITNADIKDIRALLADFAAANNIVAINVASTHTHSCIDTEGLWTKNIAKIVSNGIISGTQADEELQQGTNPEYMAFLKETVANTLKAAFIDMQPGVLTYATKDIGEDYFQNKNRPSSGQMIYDVNENGERYFTGETEIAMTDISRFVFRPDDESAKPTMMLNISAHPDVAGLPTESNSGREISGDYIFYCGQFLEKYGYNFMFFQGAIAGIYMARSATGDGVETHQRVEESQRFGYELARILLSMNLTEKEILADAKLSNSKEVEENTELVSVYDEDGNLKQEFKDYGFSFVNYVKTLISSDEATITVHNINEPFSIVADEEAKIIAVKNGDYTVYENVYGEDDVVTALPLQGVYAVTDEEGNFKEVFVDETIAKAAVNDETNAYEITVGSDVLLEIDMTDMTLDTEYTKMVVAENGKVFEGEYMPVNPGYSVWYENWEPVEEVEVAPYLNLYLKQVEIPVSNALIEAVGKLNMANYVVIAHEDGSYSTITEIGYMEIGDVFKTVFLPGEICQDLIAPNGISLIGEYAITGKSFSSQPACSIFGDDVKCFGLMNDAIGYVVPDNDYTMGDPVNHYQELISLGAGVASALMDGLVELNSEIVRV